MNVFYISTLSSRQGVERVYKCRGRNPGFAVQKFSRLIVKGLQENGLKVVALSSPPICFGDIRRGCPRFRNEIEDGVEYRYAPQVLLPGLKHIVVFFHMFFTVLFWGLRNRRDKAIVCDVLCVSACMGALLASKLNGVRSVAVVTDIYGLMVGGRKNLVSILAKKFHDRYVMSFDRYVLLTEQMNAVVNPHGRPHIVMEALCDDSLVAAPAQPVQKAYPRTLLYAGGLHEKYGLKMLAEGFLKANLDARLVIYGDGPFAGTLQRMAEADSRIEYRGVASNEEVMEEERKASLLVNPRFTTEAFTKYSFPSKNMEYMASGTPLLTTKLPGMPEEYYPYVFLFEEETVDGYASAIQKVLSLSDAELCAKGAKARDFVLTVKNNRRQAERILDLMKA